MISGIQDPEGGEEGKQKTIVSEDKGGFSLQDNILFQSKSVFNNKTKVQGTQISELRALLQLS